MAIKIKKISWYALIMFLALFSFVFAFGTRLILGNDPQNRLSSLDKQAGDVFKEKIADNIARADSGGGCGDATSSGCGDSTGDSGGGCGSGDGCGGCGCGGGGG